MSLMSVMLNTSGAWKSILVQSLVQPLAPMTRLRNRVLAFFHSFTKRSIDALQPKPATLPNVNYRHTFLRDIDDKTY